MRAGRDLEVTERDAADPVRIARIDLYLVDKVYRIQRIAQASGRQTCRIQQWRIVTLKPSVLSPGTS